MAKDRSTEKPSFIQKSSRAAKGYIGKRFGNRFINEVGREAMKSSVALAKETILPKKADPEEIRSGYHGRYKDGGKARFQQMVVEENLSENRLDELAYDLRNQARVVFCSGLFFLLLGVFISFTGESWSALRNGLGTSLASLIFIALGLRQDFCRWQVEERRFGALREYLFQKS